MSMFTFGWGLMALWGAVQPLSEPESQPGQSRGRGREGVRGSFPLGLFVCFLMVKVELLRVIFFFFFLEKFVCPLFPGDNQHRVPELTCTGSLTNTIVRELTARKLANGTYRGFFP